jgi:hypothetical protein
MMDNLPQWLTKQNVPKAIRFLLEDKELRSRSFAELWNALKRYRRNEITAKRLRAVLEDSPWVLPEWHDDLVRKAKERPELLDPDDDREKPVDEPVGILGEPLLRWSQPDEPGFVCDVLPLDGLDLLASHYDLRIAESRTDERTAVRLFLQSDGSYTDERNHSQLKLPCQLPERVLCLVDPSGEVVHTEVVQLWDPTATVNAFDEKTGKRVENADEYVFSPARSYLLLVAPGADADPAQPDWTRLPGSKPQKLIRLSLGWSREIVVRDETGDEIWRPKLRGIEPPRLQPDWARVHFWLPRGQDERFFGQEVSPRVNNLEPGVELGDC